ncbi:di-heme-cytochrome C peroxidase [Microbulbifer sp. CAU 1566]|uniref:di-heme-cytochrome C peroxidase n=1 Tax=Microbulbifer sp. CAU 1566 TaxID=2933269 RepID=UPI002006C48C|nr:di-heme-cytochrome C peroxidase [Microbulbifer sp. CAU 1566]MCK7597720.1 di-heme-cytochrome C peroxidase [Microbulbifer sp. CAU 1566]
MDFNRHLRRGLTTAAIVSGLTLTGCSIAHKFFAPNITHETITEVRYLDQGWSAKDRQLFYSTPQGTELQGLHYRWLPALELPFSKEKLASADNMRGWGFIVEPQQADSAGESGVYPVGMGSHLNPDDNSTRIDLGCALCHTGELHYKGVALRVDGGQAIHGMSTGNPGEFIHSLGAATFEMKFNPFKWARFADAVAGEDRDKREQLKQDFNAFSERFFDFAKGPGNPDNFPTTEGRGRTDAVGRIGNVVFGYNLGIEENYKVADAPVSYPFLWDIWRFDWVQYTGFTNQAMARNVGESLGVMAPVKLVDEQGELLPEGEFGRSTINIDGMQCIETTLRKLRPPKWPQEILGEIDIAKAQQGKNLFADQCVHCHGPHISKPYVWKVAGGPNDNPNHQRDVNWQWDMSGQISYDEQNQPLREDWRKTLWALPWIDIEVIGTDPKAAENFVNHTFDPGPLVAKNPNNPDDDIDRRVNAGDGLQLLMNKLVPVLYDNSGISSDNNGIADYDGLNVPFRIVNKLAYKARPLHGVWATPPFLHNGSVPTIYDLLSPLEARPVKFGVGHREYNPQKLGYVTDMRQGNFAFDTTQTGNSNRGHLFTDVEMPGRIGRRFRESERMALIEYLKVMGNPDFSEALNGDPQNWAQYSKPPASAIGEQACQGFRHPHGQLAQRGTQPSGQR